jgi:hypothetical protein
LLTKKVPQKLILINSPEDYFGEKTKFLNNFSREEFHAHGCPYKFRNYKRRDSDSDSDSENCGLETWTVDGCVGKGDDIGGWYFEGTLTENTVKENTVQGENGGRKCDIEFYYPGKNKTDVRDKTSILTNFMRNGVTTKERLSDFIMREDHEQLFRERQVLRDVLSILS